MLRLKLLLLSLFLSGPVRAVEPNSGDWTLQRMVTRAGGRTTFHAKPVRPALMNPWPRELEAEFQQRAAKIIAAQTRDQKAGVNTYFENEKRSYGFLMAHVLGGNPEKALRFLQARDHQHEVWHRETAGIDYYACFTIKHQMRKYFYFGDLLDPQYKRQMFEGARKWTAKDPMRRPHYAYEGPKEGWGPDAKNSWVDIRSTENLYLMRVTSVYLMAEETGNQETARLYKQEILDYAKTLYRIGMGEWDSENYHGHSIAPLLNLYDFAEDLEVKAAAKACLDFMSAIGAVKYWRGGFNGPTKRDYNHPQPFGGSAANSLWVWFGDHPSGKLDHWESVEVHQITSAYRPPLAVVELARKRFKRPVEILAAKPGYDATTKHRVDSGPEYVETPYIANSFQLGSLTGGTSVDGGDVNGFKLLVFDQARGAVALHASPSANPQFPGSPMYKQGVIANANRVAQQENIAIWLVENGKAPWLWVVPDSIKVTVEKGVTFLECDRTWIGIRGLGVSALTPDPKLTEQLVTAKKSRFAGHKVLSGKGQAKDYCGLAVEVGEAASHGSFAKFRAAVHGAVIDASELEMGAARYKSSDGKWLGIHWNNNPLELGVWRNGKRRDTAAAPLYDSPVISAKWGEGRLHVTTANARFECEVDERGRATFSNEPKP